MTTFRHKDGGPAFPTSTLDYWGGEQVGMSLRDWFAGMAMQGMFAADTDACTIGTKHRASIAYEMADAMLGRRAEDAI